MCLEYLQPLQNQVSENRNTALHHCSALAPTEHFTVITALSPLNCKAFLYACAHT